MSGLLDFVAETQSTNFALAKRSKVTRCANPQDIQLRTIYPLCTSLIASKWTPNIECWSRRSNFNPPDQILVNGTPNSELQREWDAQPEATTANGEPPSAFDTTAMAAVLEASCEAFAASMEAFGEALLNQSHNNPYLLAQHAASPSIPPHAISEQATSSGSTGDIKRYGSALQSFPTPHLQLGPNEARANTDLVPTSYAQVTREIEEGSSTWKRTPQLPLAASTDPTSLTLETEEAPGEATWAESSAEVVSRRAGKGKGRAIVSRDESNLDATSRACSLHENSKRSSLLEAKIDHEFAADSGSQRKSALSRIQVGTVPIPVVVAPLQPPPSASTSTTVPTTVANNVLPGTTLPGKGLAVIVAHPTQAPSTERWELCVRAMNDVGKRVVTTSEIETKLREKFPAWQPPDPPGKLVSRFRHCLSLHGLRASVITAGNQASGRAR